ncbi:hypothetical protein [Microbacterium rhizomatis]|uniref:Uncharacterized protein n=1 Tax=Microbacterium rhizomatis TaxID=1631477 RepID=A0A5J5J1X8_9MICO|nr:hypothetical protein [Microbacterium rhizomatis]KAA9106490.1 hypothetical protein F6B43_15230 [Microbacterium rhizomatis]
MTQDEAEPAEDGRAPATGGESAGESAPTRERVRSTTPAMRWALLGVLAIVLVGIGVTVWLMASGGAPGSTGSAGSPGTAQATTAGPAPGATPTAGSEVLPPTAVPDATLPPVAAPSSAPPTPLIAPPYPESATADFSLVPGFPEQVMGPAPASDILQSAIATEGNVMQVTLVGRTDASPDDVRAHYTELWSGLGLTNAGTTSDGSLSFTGPLESLTVSTTVGGTGTRYTVFGIFRAS